MKKIWSLLTVLLLLTALSGCSGADIPSETAGESRTQQEQTSAEETESSSEEEVLNTYDNQVTVMCYNIYYKDVDARSGNILDLIRKNDPDVLCLQEVSTDWIPYLKSFMEEDGYSYYGYGRYGGEMSDADLQSGDQFTPILWKTDAYEFKDSGHFWLSSTPDTYSAAWVDGTISNYPRCVNWVILKDNETGGELLVLNIHTDPENSAVRTNSSKLTVEMLSSLRAGVPAVLCGDWNMGITDSAYYAVTENGYSDVRFAAAETTHGGSFNAWGERADDNYAFGDHIFMSEGMAAERFSVVNDYYDGVHISDHCPLLAVLDY